MDRLESECGRAKTRAGEQGGRALAEYPVVCAPRSASLQPACTALLVRPGLGHKADGSRTPASPRGAALR